MSRRPLTTPGKSPCWASRRTSRMPPWMPRSSPTKARAGRVSLAIAFSCSVPVVFSALPTPLSASCATPSDCANAITALVPANPSAAPARPACSTTLLSALPVANSIELSEAKPTTAPRSPAVRIAFRKAVNCSVSAPSSRRWSRSASLRRRSWCSSSRTVAAVWTALVRSRRRSPRLASTPRRKSLVCRPRTPRMLKSLTAGAIAPGSARGAGAPPATTRRCRCPRSCRDRQLPGRPARAPPAQPRRRTRGGPGAARTTAASGSSGRARRGAL